MDSKVITKFTVASDAGVGALLYLTESITREKFSGFLPDRLLTKYISEQFNEKKLINDLNDILSQHWLIVYVNGNPAGYAKITSKGEKPEMGARAAIGITHFGILRKYDEPLVWLSLYEKCIAVSDSYDLIWLQDYIENPVIAYFKENGFKQLEEPGHRFGLPLPSAFLVRERPVL